MPFLTTLPAWVWWAASAVSTGAQTAGQVVQAMGMASQYEKQAELQRQAGQMQAAAVKRRAEKIMSAQTARYAASGVDVSSGSPVTVRKMTAQEAAYDAAIIRWNADTAAMMSEYAESAYRSRIPGIIGGGIFDIARSGLSLLAPTTTNQFQMGPLNYVRMER